MDGCSVIASRTVAFVLHALWLDVALRDGRQVVHALLLSLPLARAPFVVRAANLVVLLDRIRLGLLGLFGDLLGRHGLVLGSLGQLPFRVRASVHATSRRALPSAVAKKHSPAGCCCWADMVKGEKDGVIATARKRRAGLRDGRWKTKRRNIRSGREGDVLGTLASELKTIVIAPSSRFV